MKHLSKISETLRHLLLWAGFAAVSCVSLWGARMDVKASDTRNAVVFFDADTFAGWPANGGSWTWGEEILVSYSTGPYEEKTDTHSHRGRHLDTSFSRSLDGGKTWKTEDHREFLDTAPIPCGGVEDMTAAGFALRLRGNAFFVSYDKGHTWRGPYLIPNFSESGAYPNARTSYIVTGPQSALLFMTSRSEQAGGGEGERGRAYVLGTKDGFATIEFLGWMSPELSAKANKQELEHPIFSIMPSVVRMEADHYVAALRQRIHKRTWTDIFESRDGGKTWQFLAKAEEGGNNPPALLKLADGKTLALVYGFRGRELGLRARLSRDGGRTWDDEYVLRKDARTWDIGYARAHLMPNGDILALYYYTTKEFKQQYIDSTRWNVPLRGSPKDN